MPGKKNPYGVVEAITGSTAAGKVNTGSSTNTGITTAESIKANTVAVNNKTGAGSTLLNTVSGTPSGVPGVVEVNTQSVNTSSGTVSETEKNASGGESYVSVNDYIHGGYGSGSTYDKHVAVRDELRDYYSRNPDAGQAMTREEMESLAEEYGVTGSFEEYYKYLDNITPGTSGADEYLLSNGAYELTRAVSSEWWELEGQRVDALNAGNTARANQIAVQQKQLNDTNNRIKLAFGYSGGTDGSGYFTAGELDLSKYNPADNDVGHNRGPYYHNGGVVYPNGGNTGGGGSGAMVPSYTQTQNFNELREMLKEWRKNAESQVSGEIDFAVQQAVAELDRVLRNAQSQYKEQNESVDRDAMQALDNSALYAELRGDKGGIGWEQYNAIQNTAARNHLAVQQAQTKLATDTARQIEDLRAQGEFQKANEVLELAQTYLSQLLSLEKWAAEVSLAERKFQDSVDRWKAEYAMDQQKLQISQNQWQQEFTASQNKRVASMGEALLQAGVVPTAEQLKAMGMNAQQADSFLILRQLELAR